MEGEQEQTDDVKSLSFALSQYEKQLHQVQEALEATSGEQRKSLISLAADLEQLMELTRENLGTIQEQAEETKGNWDSSSDGEAKFDAFKEPYKRDGGNERRESSQEKSATNTESNGGSNQDSSTDSDEADVGDELSSLPGMRCAVYVTRAWGGRATRHNAMVSRVEPRLDSTEDTFKNIMVRVLYTHPTQNDMVPCPYYFEGECKFNDEQCRYSHGEVVPFHSLKECGEPDYEALEYGSYVLAKLTPPKQEDGMKKICDRHLVWQYAQVRSVDPTKRQARIVLQGQSRPSEHTLPYQQIFPIIGDMIPQQIVPSLRPADDSETEDDVELPPKDPRIEEPSDSIDPSRFSSLVWGEDTGPRILGDWEKHTRGIGSRLMQAMGYTLGAGLGADGSGRLDPVPTRVLPLRASLDRCMQIRQATDPLQDEERLQKRQKRREEQNKKNYDKNGTVSQMFDLLNNIMSDKPSTSTEAKERIEEPKPQTSKEYNIEQFKVGENIMKMEKEVEKMTQNMNRQTKGSPVHKQFRSKLDSMTQVLDGLRAKEKSLIKEKNAMRAKQKLTIF